MNIVKFAFGIILSMATLPALGQSRQVSQSPGILQRAHLPVVISSPFSRYSIRFDSFLREEGYDSASLNLQEKMDILSEYLPRDVVEIALAPLEQILEQSLEDTRKDYPQMLATIAYVHGLANPLFSMTVVEVLKAPWSNEGRKFVIRYSVASGHIRYCEVTPPAEFTKVTLGNCQMFDDTGEETGS